MEWIRVVLAWVAVGVSLFNPDYGGPGTLVIAMLAIAITVLTLSPNHRDTE